LKSLLIIFLALFSAHFSTVEARNAQGKIKEGKYISQSPPFSIEIPALTSEVKTIQKNNEPGMTESIMQDDMGHLFRILICHSADFGIPAEKHVAFFSDSFKNVMLPILAEVVPKVSILREEGLKLDNDQPALFVLVNFPNGSILQNAKNGERFDSVRGFLYFYQNGDLLTLSYQNDLLFRPNSFGIQYMTAEEKESQYRKALLTSANSYQKLPAKKNSTASR